jgi:hypothetical protein
MRPTGEAVQWTAGPRDVRRELAFQPMPLCSKLCSDRDGSRRIGRQQDRIAILGFFQEIASFGLFRQSVMGSGSV